MKLPVTEKQVWKRLYRIPELPYINTLTSQQSRESRSARVIDNLVWWPNYMKDTILKESIHVRIVEFCLKLQIFLDCLKVIFCMIDDSAINIISQAEAKYIPKPCSQP